MNKLKPLIIFFFVLMVASCALVSRNTKPAAPDPMYKGKSASQWATEFAFRSTEEAREALNHLGADATPFLVPYLDRQDSLRPKLARHVRLNTAIAFRDIQPVSRAAIPVLIEHLNSRDGEVRMFSIEALGNIGPEATAAVPALKLRLKREVVERVAAAWALWQIEHNAAEVVPIFEEALDRKHRVQWLVMRYLAAMGSAAEPVVPLIEALAGEEQGDPRMASLALQALARISTNPVPFLIRKLKARDPGIRVSAALVLGNLGPPAAASVGSLEALLQDDELGRQYIEEKYSLTESVGHAAREALDKILGEPTEDSNEK